MNAWRSLRPIPVMLAVMLAMLGVAAALVSSGRAGWIIPSPEGAASQLVQAIGAHRSTGAHNQLTREMQQAITKREMLNLARSIENGPLQGIEDAHELDADETGEQAVARVAVKFKNHTTHILTFPLKKENGLWKVSSLAALEALPK